MASENKYAILEIYTFHLFSVGLVFFLFAVCFECFRYDSIRNKEQTSGRVIGGFDPSNHAIFKRKRQNLTFLRLKFHTSPLKFALPHKKRSATVRTRWSFMWGPVSFCINWFASDCIWEDDFCRARITVTRVGWSLSRIRSRVMYWNDGPRLKCTVLDGGGFEENCEICW